MATKSCERGGITDERKFNKTREIYMKTPNTLKCRKTIILFKIIQLSNILKYLQIRITLRCLSSKSN